MKFYWRIGRLISMDSDGIVRVNPYFRSIKHNDWFFQFTRSGNDIGAFTDFAAEFRTYWKSTKHYKDIIRQ